MHIPEGSFKFTVGQGQFDPIIQRFGGPNALSEWHTLTKALQPIMDLSVAVPPLALRNDIGVILTLLPYLPKLIVGAPVATIGVLKMYLKILLKILF